MASYRAYGTPLYVPCRMVLSVLASIWPDARAGDAAAVVAKTTAARMRTPRDNEYMEVLRYTGKRPTRDAQRHSTPVNATASIRPAVRSAGLARSRRRLSTPDHAGPEKRFPRFPPSSESHRRTTARWTP